MVTGKSQPGIEPVHFPASPEPVASNSPPSRRDLASWWRQFKRNSRKDDLKGTSWNTVSYAQPQLWSVVAPLQSVVLAEGRENAPERPARVAGVGGGHRGIPRHSRQMSSRTSTSYLAVQN